MGSICAGQGVISIIDPMKPRLSLSHKLEMSTHVFIETQKSFYAFYLLHANPIGYGEHGEVWLCNKKSNNKLRAVKILEKAIIPSLIIEDKTIIKTFEKLKSVKSNVIIKTFQAFESRNDCFLITEYANEGNLYELMTINQGIIEQQAAKIVFQLLLAILKLQDNCQWFNDIKPENILFTDKNNLLIKFNPVNLLSILKDSSNSRLFLSPKGLIGEYSKKCDSWSIGLIMYFLLSGHLPDEKNLPFAVSAIPENFFSGVSDNAKNLLLWLLKTDENERASVREAISHDWIHIHCDFEELEITN